MQDIINTAPTQPKSTKGLGQTLFRLFNRRQMKAFEGIPGPEPTFPLGNALDFVQGKQAWEVLGDYGQQYGGLAVTWMLSKPSLVLNDPALIRQVLLSEEQQKAQSKALGNPPSRCPMSSVVNFYKDLPRKALRPMLTNTSTFIAKDSGDTWQHLSQNNPFNMVYFRDWLESQLSPLKTFLEARTHELLTSSQGDVLPAYDTIQKLTFDGFSLATVGRVFPDEVFDQFNRMCAVGTQRMTRSSLANWLIPETPQGRDYKATSRQWFELFSQVVAETQANPDSQSLLSWVLERGGSDFTDEQLRNFCAGVYPGGAISAPSGTTTALYMLWQNPEYLPTLLADIETLFAEPLTLQRLEQCTGLDQALRETLRLRPPVAFFTRNVIDEGIEFAGRKIPGKTQVYITSSYLHQHPEYWTEPKRFNPKRWDAETCEKNPYGSDYFFPFGRGSRACIGQNFARVFMKLSLAVLLNQLSIQFEFDSDASEFFFAVAVPRQLKFKFNAR